MKPQKIAVIIPNSYERISFLTSKLGLTIMEHVSHFVFYNTGALLIATILKNMNHDVKLIFDQGKSLVNELDDIHIICLSLTTAAATRGYEIARSLSGKKIIIGGPHASAFPDEAAKYADHVVIGEGEKVLPKIIEGEITAKVVKTDIIENLDESPYLDFSLLPFKPKNFPILTSRGCPHHCCYCAVTKLFGHKTRLRSPEHIVSEIKYYIKTYGKVDRLDIISPNFTANRTHAKKILNMLIAEGITPCLEVRSSTHIGNDPEIPKLLSKFKRVSLIVGIESFEEDSLKYYRKSRKKDNLEMFVTAMKDNGINVCGGFIWGNKFDSPDSMQRLIENIYALKLSHFHIYMLTPFPGTDIYEEVKDQIFVKDWKYFDFMHVTHFHPLMDPYTMQKCWIDAQKHIWSMSEMLKRKTDFFSPPINKFFYWFINRFIDKEFSAFLDFLKELNHPSL